jgi:predicted DNA-binding protein (MmcQ/YjbR family)
MNIEEFRSFCLSMKGVTEGLPFDHNTLVFKVSGKIFAITDLDDFESINLKCDPDKAITLREEFPEVQPGYHMNKKHWNTIDTNGKIPDSLLQEWIRDSYNLVVSGLSKKDRESLK